MAPSRIWREREREEREEIAAAAAASSGAVVYYTWRILHARRSPSYGFVARQKRNWRQIVDHNQVVVLLFPFFFFNIYYFCFLKYILNYKFSKKKKQNFISNKLFVKFFFFFKIIKIRFIFHKKKLIFIWLNYICITVWPFKIPVISGRFKYLIYELMVHDLCQLSYTARKIFFGWLVCLYLILINF